MRLLVQAEAPTTELAAATAALSAPKMAVSAPSAETARLAEEADETIDAEMLEIFLEEADEVLATVTENLDLCHAQPNDKEALTTLRRSFHTLKGSGRMVGLWDLGEVAWAIEQVMNKWLQDEKNASPELLALLGQAHQHFLGWVAALKANGTVKIVADDLVAEAERLRTGAGTPSVATAPEAQAAVAQEVPAAEEIIAAAEPEAEIMAEPVMEISALPEEYPAEETINLVELPVEQEPQTAVEIPFELEEPVPVAAPEEIVTAELLPEISVEPDRCRSHGKAVANCARNAAERGSAHGRGA